MSGTLHIAVFAKAPVPGQVKTRLIPLLGAERAALAYRAMTRHALQIACAVAPAQVSLWCAGAVDHPFLVSCAEAAALTRYRQSDGDIGQRMADCLRRCLRYHDRVLLIGTDAPVLTAGDLRGAEQALRFPVKMVFTPAEDGGYVLVGMRREDAASLGQALAAAFDGISWSTAAVMAQTRASCVAAGWQAGRDWGETTTRWDVDTPADYARAVAEGLLVA